MSWYHITVEFITWFVLGYFMLLNGGYMVLNVLAIVSLRMSKYERTLDGLPQVYSALEIPISVLVPAYNEEASIAASIRSMLQLSYSEFEIIVINDGSRDGTLDVLKREFSLQLFPEALRVQLQAATGEPAVSSENHLALAKTSTGAKRKKGAAKPTAEEPPPARASGGDADQLSLFDQPIDDTD